MPRVFFSGGRGPGETAFLGNTTPKKTFSLEGKIFFGKKKGATKQGVFLKRINPLLLKKKLPKFSGEGQRFIFERLKKGGGSGGDFNFYFFFCWGGGLH